MSVHETLKFGAEKVDFHDPDPGDAGILGSTASDCHYIITTAAAETRTLPVPRSEGLKRVITLVSDGGDLTVTVTSGFEVAGTEPLVFDDAGDSVTLESRLITKATSTAGAVYRWRIIAIDGVTGSVGQELETVAALTAVTTLIAGTTVTGGTGVIATTGDIPATAGNFDAVAGTLDLQDGGVVTQGTSKSTGVTLSKYTGKITTHVADLLDDTAVSFTVTNTLVAVTDHIIVNIISGATVGAYRITVDTIAAGSFVISLKNESGGTLGETILIGVGVIKGSIT